MPRPGPRPFECVRRSWHSDRHQPIRGSIIQQIFRLVNENHSPGTKKKREWQEKLPLVVLKSEEIMYSKANSEAEYLDSETLWDRVNDAINTIIRKDESMETGEFLPPCVEAALNLGCVPVRSSRSQRNSNSRSYLSPRNQDSVPAPTRTMATATNTRNLNLPNAERPNAVNPTHQFSEDNMDTRPSYKVTPPGSTFYPPSIENFPKQTVTFESRASSVYPLYHGFHFHSTHQNKNTIIVGTPVFQAAHEPLPSSSQRGCSERLLSFERDDNGSKSQPQLAECDLSLRLGLVSSNGKGLTCVDDVDLGPRTSQCSLRSKEFSFFPLNSQAEQVQNLVTDVRKQKEVGESQCFLHLEPDFNQINERMKRGGL